MQRTKIIFREVAENLVLCMEKLDEMQVEKVIDKILKAKKIFVLGAGHSGLIGKILAMKLSQLGFSSYVIGEVVTPSLGEADLLVSISQSGETLTVVTLTRKAKNLGVEVVAITSSANSSLSELADTTLFVPDKSESVHFSVLSLLGDKKHKNMSGALFGMNIFVLFYGIVCELVARTSKSPEEIDLRHANIE
ncbi:SIS domain-containing protein [Candidatus Aerophobetes bacterium]|nr:SIS domain-containing protein [Candidatus Aerophobetes bacterium]